MKASQILVLLICLTCVQLDCKAQAPATKVASKPLFRDPIYDGAADPVCGPSRKGFR